MTAGKYDERTERHWYVRDRRGHFHPCSDEDDANYLAAQNPAAEGVVLYRDVHYGPMVEADR